MIVGIFLLLYLTYFFGKSLAFENMKFSSVHPEFADLVRRIEASLSETELQRMDFHLNVCAVCMKKLQKLENFFTSAKPKVSETVPSATTARLLNIFRHSKKPQKSGLKRYLQGILIFDDWMPKFAVNERLFFSETRQMLFRAEHFEIDLRLNFDDGKCQVSGQVFPDCTFGKVKIIGQKFSEEVSFNPSCRFVFLPVEEGIYDFLITTNDSEIRLSQVSLTN